MTGVLLENDFYIIFFLPMSKKWCIRFCLSKLTFHFPCSFITNAVLLDVSMCILPSSFRFCTFSENSRGNGAILQDVSFALECLFRRCKWTELRTKVNLVIIYQRIFAWRKFVELTQVTSRRFIVGPNQLITDLVCLQITTICHKYGLKVQQKWQFSKYIFVCQWQSMTVI